MNKILQLFLFFWFCSSGFFLFSQKSHSSWSVQFENQKSFIENKGQFNERNSANGHEIEYAADFGSSQIYFTKKGLIYHFEKKEKNKKRKEGDRSQPKYFYTREVVNMRWENANPDVQLIAEEKSTGHYSYVFHEKGEIKNINNINGFKKLVYKNLYPNIDVEFVFHSETGIKYSVFLHPGADISAFKMMYPDVKFINVNENGQLIISTTFGDIIEQVPFTFYSVDNKKIESSFHLNDNVASFTLPQNETTSATSAIIIDPWVQTPALANSNGVWEVEKDDSGNVYIIGGDMPMKLQKYSSTGVLQWTYSTPWDTANSWLGTLATDNSGNSYITSGSSAVIQKIDSGGTMIWSKGGGTMDEYWTLAFNSDQTKLAVGGTRLDINNIQNSHGVIYDINLNNGNVIDFINVTNARTYSIFGITQTEPNEIRTMSFSENGRYYFLSLDTIGSISQNFSACFSKPLMTFNSTYNFGYRCENYRMSEGNSGIKAIKATRDFIYTLNGTSIHKRSLADGAILSGAVIPGGLATTSNGFTQIGSGGIDIDSCGNVYAGSGNGVIKFDADLNLIDSALTQFAVFDVTVGYNGEVLACGATGNSSSVSRIGYVESLNMASCQPSLPEIEPCDAGICSSIESLCSFDSSFSLFNATPGGIWSGPGIIDSIGGIFDPSFSGPGSFYVRYSLNCGSDSILVEVDSCYELNICLEFNGDLTVTNGTGPYIWEVAIPAYETPITNQVECIACGYTWNAFVNECFVIFPTPAVSCEIPAGWSAFDTSNTVNPPDSGTVRVRDFYGNKTIVNFSGLAPCKVCNLYLSISSTPDSGNISGTATVIIDSGFPPYSYQWSENAGSQNSSTATGLSTGFYFVTVTDSVNCILVDSIQVSAFSAIKSKLSNFNSQISIFPNPAKNELKVLINSGSISSLKISVFNSLGKEVIKMEKERVSQVNEIPVDLSGLTPGIYFITVNGDNVSSKTQFIKE